MIHGDLVFCINEIVGVDVITLNMVLKLKTLMSTSNYSDKNNVNILLLKRS